MRYKTRMQVKTAMAPARPVSRVETKHIVVPFQVKADTIDPKARTFEGLSAVWDLDLGNDVIINGAFKQTLIDWKKSGNAIPLLNSHDHYDIFAALGQCLEATETKDGLLTTWEVIEGEDGDAVLARLRPSARTGRAIISKMSIGYEPVKWSYEQPANSDNPYDRIRHLEVINWKETSLVLFPMAPGASIDCDTVKMFAKSVADTDRQSVDAATKQELRRLASRIGILLSSRKTDEQVAADPDALPADVSPSPDPVTDPPAPETPTDDLEDPTPDPKSDPEAPADPEPIKSSVYLYDEALQQRLQKVLLKTKMSDLGI